MKAKLFLLFGLSSLLSFSQLNTGDKAPDFILNIGHNSIRSYIMPYMKNILLINFWKNTSSESVVFTKQLRLVSKKYKTAMYSTANEFEIINVGLQMTDAVWNQAINQDTLNAFDNAIAPRGFDEEVCLKYFVDHVPYSVLIDEEGIIVALNPSINKIEEYLNGKRNIHTITKDIVGILTTPIPNNEKIPNVAVILYNHFGDSIGKAITNKNGEFKFAQVKLNQDLIVKVKRQDQLKTFSSLTIYNHYNNFVSSGKKVNDDFEFHIPSSRLSKLTLIDTATLKSQGIEQMNMVKHLEFASNGHNLTEKDLQLLEPLKNVLLKNPKLKLEFTVHTDSKLGNKLAQLITDNQMATLIKYFRHYGIKPEYLHGKSNGCLEPRHSCINANCSEQEHGMNRRVEFQTYKN